MIVTFTHHKGGTGKTTTCINVAGCAAKAGRKVLVVDMDPQANATSGLGVDLRTIQSSMGDVLTGGADLPGILLETESGVHLAPATATLIESEPALYGMGNDRTERLARALEDVERSYDLVFVDTPPGAGILMRNAIMAARQIVVTLDPGIFALEDLETLRSLLHQIGGGSRGERPLDMGVVTRALRPGFFDSLLGRRDLLRDVTDLLKRRFRSLHVIPYDRSVFESQRRGLPLSHVAPQSPAGRAYQALAQDVMNHG